MAVSLCITTHVVSDKTVTMCHMMAVVLIVLTALGSV